MEIIYTIRAFFLQLLAPFQIGVNLLDIIIVGIFGFYAYEGYTIGLALAFMDLVSFILSFLIALKFYGTLAALFTHFFSMPLGFANALGFFFAALISEIILNLLLRKIVSFIPKIPSENTFEVVLKKTNHILGIFPGIASAAIILSFLLSVIIALPSSPVLKESVSTSKIGSTLIANTAFAEKNLNDIFGGALHESLNFFTIEPKSTESVQLHFSVDNGSIDPVAEEQMITMVNNERTSRGLSPLTTDDSLRNLARRYSDDMFKRGYFSHYNPEGESPFDRMEHAGIAYSYAGENLALAPSTELAMQGLMNSPGHKANILKAEFKQIGIGVIDGGIYGKMFTQEVTD